MYAAGFFLRTKEHTRLSNDRIKTGYLNDKAYLYSNTPIVPPPIKIVYHPLKNYGTGGKIETYARALFIPDDRRFLRHEI